MKRIILTLSLMFALHAPAQVAMMTLNDVPGDMQVCVTNWGPYIASATNTLSTNLTALANSFAQYAATNQVTRWQDASNPDIWWEANGGTNLTAYGPSDSQYYYVADQLSGYIQQTSGAFPYLVEGQEEGSFDGGLAVLAINGAGSWRSSGAAFPQALVNEMWPGTAYVYRATAVLASYNLTTGNVWQAISSLQGSVSNATLTADGAMSSINNHTANPSIHLQAGDRAKIDGAISAPAATNIMLAVKELHADAYTNLIWRTVWSNGWCYAIAFTNVP